MQLHISEYEIEITLYLVPFSSYHATLVKLSVMMGSLYLLNSFSVIFVNITINHILSKIRFFGLHFCPESMSLTSTTLMYPGSWF